MLMDLGIAGKVAIVTGGSHGIGRAVSEELGRNGCRVVVVACGQEQLDSTVDAIRSEGGEEIAVSADLTAFDRFPRMVAEAEDVFGPPDTAIYPPADSPSGMFAEFTAEALDRAYVHVVKGFSLFTVAFFPTMKAHVW